jgi:formate hydrogenlyase transcriptional activator
MYPLEDTSNEDDSSLERKYQRYTQLLGVAGELPFRRRPDVLFRNLAPRLRAVIPFDIVNFALYDAQLEKMKMFAWDGGEWPAQPTEVPVNESVAGWVWQNQSALAIGDLRHERRFESGLHPLRERNVRSYCALPLTKRDDKLGALGFGSRLPQAFRSDDECFLGRVAQMVALCMDRSLAEVTLSLARLVSARSAPSGSSLPDPCDKPLPPSDMERLRQLAATLVPLVEEIQEELEGCSAQFRVSDPSEGIRLVPSISSRLVDDSRAPVSPERETPETNDRTANSRLAASESLHAWEQLLAVYSDVSRVGLCILDREFHYRAINSELARMNGFPAEDHLGRSVRDILGDSANAVEGDIGTVLATGRPLLNREISGLLPGRTEPGHWIRHHIPIRSASGDITQIGIVVAEVTEQKKLEECFRSVSQKLKLEKKRSHAMTEVGRLLTGRWDLSRVFPKVSAHLRRVLHQEYASLSLRDEKSGQLAMHAVDFPLRRIASRYTEPGAPGDPIAALQEAEPLILNQDDLRKSGSDAAKYLLAEGLQSLCCVPLLRPRGSLGVLVVGSTRSTAFGDEDLALLNQVAAQLAIALENDRATRRLEQLTSRFDPEETHIQTGEHAYFDGIIGNSPALQKVLRRVEIVAPSDATVLLLGETGTGKGLFARALHQSSRRKDQNFVTLNCAAIPTGLLESELFGHEKGAFTGAIRQKIGRLELAQNGTLFLDEVGEIPYELQPKLLRVLQDHEFERLGSVKTIKVDLRLVAATNRDLAKSVIDREFRSDLYYRLNVFPVRLPSLRERREDISLLVSYFVRKYAAKMGRTLETVSTETMQALMAYSWPGNVRELENFIERSIILSEGTILQSPLVELKLESPAHATLSLEHAEKEHIIVILRESGGLISGPHGAAQRLGLKRTTLQSKIDRLGITPADYSDGMID